MSQTMRRADQLEPGDTIDLEPAARQYGDADDIAAVAYEYALVESVAEQTVATLEGRQVHRVLVSTDLANYLLPADYLIPTLEAPHA